MPVVGNSSADLGIFIWVAISFVLIWRYGAAREQQLRVQRDLIVDIHHKLTAFLDRKDVSEEACRLLLNVTSNPINLQLLKRIFFGSIKPNKEICLANHRFHQRYYNAKETLDHATSRELNDILDEFVVAVSYSSVIFGYIYRNYVLPYHRDDLFGFTYAAPAAVIWFGWMFGTTRIVAPQKRNELAGSSVVSTAGAGSGSIRPSTLGLSDGLMSRGINKAALKVAETANLSRDYI